MDAKCRHRWLFDATLACSLLVGPVARGDGVLSPETITGDVRHRNPDIASARLGARGAALAATAAEPAIFPSAVLQASHAAKNQPLPVTDLAEPAAEPSAARETIDSVATGLKLRTPFGLTGEISLQQIRREAGDAPRYHQVTPRLRLLQPLLKGAGVRVGALPRLMKDSAQHLAEIQATEVACEKVTEALRIYWRIAKLDAERAASEAAIEAARRTKDRATARHREGQATGADVAAAEASVAVEGARALSLVAEIDAQRAALRLLANSEASDFAVQGLESAPRTFDALAGKLAAIADGKGLETVPRVARSRAQVEAARFEEETAKDAAAPDVALSLEYGTNGAGFTLKDAWEAGPTGRHPTWLVQLVATIPLPLGGRDATVEAKAVSRLARTVEFDQALNQTRDEAATLLRDANAARARAASTQRQLVIAKEMDAARSALQAAGRLSTYKYLQELDASRALADAAAAESLAMVELELRAAQLLGTGPCEEISWR